MNNPQKLKVIAGILLSAFFMNAVSVSAAKPDASAGGSRDAVAPIVSIMSPTDGQAVAGQVTVSVQASDNVGVSKVVFLIDGVTVSTDTISPYAYAWNTLTFADATHGLTAKAYDKAGNIGISSTVNVAVKNSASITGQISSELDYIANCSYTEKNINYPTWGFLQADDGIYGAINVNRAVPFLDPSTTSWVRPGESAMAVIGMMQGLSYLNASNAGIAAFAPVVENFFQVWVLDHSQAQNTDPASADFGAFMDSVSYDAFGNYQAIAPKWKTDVTAQMIIANWKYYEYKVKTGQAAEAESWISSAWPIEMKAADYLVRMHDLTPAGLVHLLPGNSTEAEFNTWIHFAANAVPALRSASAWAKKTGGLYGDYDRVADDLVIGIGSMKDSTRPNFFKYRQYLGNNAYSAPTYGDSIDQLTFSPYETGAVTLDGFAKQISDWWTNGDNQIKMTVETANPSDWRYFGTHWHYYFSRNASNAYIYPGPGFQLAKVEWKYGKTYNDLAYVKRSGNRLAWAKGLGYSSLWWFVTGQKEAGVPNGFQDWRNASNYTQTAETWARFSDTSGYFIETLLMNEADIDTSYNPES